MPRPTVLLGRSRRLAPVPGAGPWSPPPDRWFEPQAPSGQKRAAGRKLGLPRLCRPPDLPRRGWELSGVSTKKEPHAPAVSDRTWPDETRGRPPESAGPSAAPPVASSEDVAPNRSGSQKNVHKGSHRAADPGALFSRIGRPRARAFVTILLRRGITRPGATVKAAGDAAPGTATLGPRPSGGRPQAAAQPASPADCPAWGDRRQRPPSFF